MKFRFTHHAEYRIFIERHISAEEIKEVVNKPDSSTVLPDGIVKNTKRVKNGILTVIYTKDKSVYTIITAYFK